MPEKDRVSEALGPTPRYAHEETEALMVHIPPEIHYLGVKHTHTPSPFHLHADEDTRQQLRNQETCAGKVGVLAEGAGDRVVGRPTPRVLHDVLGRPEVGEVGGINTLLQSRLSRAEPVASCESRDFP